MKQGFTAGCGIEVTLSMGDKTYEFVKPSYHAAITEEWDTEKDNLRLNDEELLERVKRYHVELRKLVESEIDVDIFDIKQIKLYQEILNKKN